METRGKLIAGIGLLAALLAISVPNFRKIIPLEQTGCETYQGNRRGDVGEEFFVFDPQTLEERGNRDPNYTLLGNPEWVNRFEIGRQYILQYERFSSSTSPTFTKQPINGRLISFDAESCR